MKNSKIDDLTEKADELWEEMDSAPAKKIIDKIQKEIDAVLNLDPQLVKAHQEKLQKKHAKLMRSYKDEEKAKHQAQGDEDSRGTCIRSVKCSVAELRTFIAFLQKFVEATPQAGFLYDLCEWGLSEDNLSGGFAIFNPKKISQENLHSQFVSMLATDFKFGMNIYSSTADWSTEPLDTDTPGFGEVAGPNRSIFDMESIKEQNPEWEEVIAEGDTTFGYYVFYEEARERLLQDNLSHPNMYISWMYFALLNQDTEIVEKFYTKAKETIATLDNETQGRINHLLLKSFGDGEKINRLLQLPDNGLIETLKRNNFFEDLKPILTDYEKSTYLTSKAKKVKP